MKRTRSVRARVFFAGIAVMAVACGTAAAAMPTLSFRLHARLVPVAGMAAAGGTFDGMVVTNVDGMRPTSALPRRAHGWQLAWKLRLYALKGPVAASVRIRSTKSAPAVTRMLCRKCAGMAHGMLTMTGSQVIRMARGEAVVVVQTRSGRLRGAVAVVRQPRSSHR